VKDHHIGNTFFDEAASAFLLPHLFGMSVDDGSEASGTSGESGGAGVGVGAGDAVASAGASAGVGAGAVVGAGAAAPDSNTGTTTAPTTGTTHGGARGGALGPDWLASSHTRAQAQPVCSSNWQTLFGQDMQVNLQNTS
jgi:hypothetical protein